MKRGPKLEHELANATRLMSEAEDSLFRLISEADRLVRLRLSTEDRQLLHTLLGCVADHRDSHSNRVQVKWIRGSLQYFVALNPGAHSWHPRPLIHATNISSVLLNLEFATGTEDDFAFTDLAMSWYANQSGASLPRRDLPVRSADEFEEESLHRLLEDVQHFCSYVEETRLLDAYWMTFVQRIRAFDFSAADLDSYRRFRRIVFRIDEQFASIFDSYSINDIFPPYQLRDAAAVFSNIAGFLSKLDTLDEPALLAVLNRLKSIADIELASVQSTQPLARHGFHPAVIEVAGRLFEDGHYHLAVMQALLAVNSAVRQKSGSLAADGVALARNAFSANMPILKLSDQEAEQRGFMELFAGAWSALRNPAGHRIMDDAELGPTGALEWIGFASALMRLVDKAEIANGQV